MGLGDQVQGMGLKFRVNIGALIIRTGFWGPLCYNYNKEPPKYLGNYFCPFLIGSKLGVWGLGFREG